MVMPVPLCRFRNLITRHSTGPFTYPPSVHVKRERLLPTNGSCATDQRSYHADPLPEVVSKKTLDQVHKPLSSRQRIPTSKAPRRKAWAGIVTNPLLLGDSNRIMRVSMRCSTCATSVSLCLARSRHSQFACAAIAGHEGIPLGDLTILTLLQGMYECATLTNERSDGSSSDTAC
jgi:hypothetical protein